MKIVSGIALFCLFSVHLSFGQDGAWRSDDGITTQWLLVSDGAFTWTKYETMDGAFVSTLGGLIKEDEDETVFLIEFCTYDTTMIGFPQTWTMERGDDGIRLKTPSEVVHFSVREEGPSGELRGAWLFSGRERDGELQRRPTDGPRKTMKILTGSRFQWIAYHITDKRFLGTGGGTYTTVDGVYTEQIEFFSRDNTRVGAKLPFAFEKQGDDWHHKGKSSKGDPMYEIWSLRKS